MIKKYLALPGLVGRNTFSGKHFANRVKVVSDYLKRKAEVNSFPTMAEIETTSFCNLKCIMCGRNFGEEAKKDQHMELNLYKRIIDQCSGKLELAILHAGGEPLMQPKIFEMINYAHDANIGTWMSSNATILNEDKARKLLASKLDGLVLSIDATTAETYEKIRVGGNFEKTKANIIRFLDIRKEVGSQLPVTVQAIEMEENKHEIEEFKSFWSKFDINLIVKPMINWEINNIEDMVYPDVICDRPWYWLFIRSNGLVPPCGHDYKMKAVYGDLNKNSVAEVWNSDSAQNFRRSVLHGKKGHYVCSHCDYAPARKRGVAGNVGQAGLDMLTICKILFWLGYHKVNRRGL